MRNFQCDHCGRRVFYGNLGCSACGAELGFVPAALGFAAYRAEAGDWRALGPLGGGLVPCANRAVHGCNWMIAAGGPALCDGCATTDATPELQAPAERGRWRRLEGAKRRLFYSLLVLRLPAPARAADPAHGLLFRFLADGAAPADARRIVTGHAAGVITINLAEADDAFREQVRTQMREPYRTLLGHFRHEVGHYYWDRLIAGSRWIEPWRALFGDERADYAAALRTHYATPPPDWSRRHVSAYASAHPWEDWAECWAHYLHIHDGLETAAAWGLQLARALPEGNPVRPTALAPDMATIADALVEQWLPVSQFINAMDRSLGTPDSYPFTLPTPVLEKLEFIHRVIGAATRGEAPMRFGPGG